VTALSADHRRVLAGMLFVVALVLGILAFRGTVLVPARTVTPPTFCGENLSGPGLICSQSIGGLDCVPDKGAYLCTGWNPPDGGDTVAWVSAIAAAISAVAAVALLLPRKRSNGQTPSTGGGGEAPSPSPT
jgi:hypothetical protein